jgi:hypothetical protein
LRLLNFAAVLLALFVIGGGLGLAYQWCRGWTITTPFFVTAANNSAPSSQGAPVLNVLAPAAPATTASFRGCGATSFAQFEREVIGERICDKVAASKRKGIWMGGSLPFGDDVRECRLVINPDEASTVRHIFERYLELGSVRLVKEELDRRGVTSKIRTSTRRERQHGRSPGPCQNNDPAHTRLFSSILRVVPKLSDWMVERSQFELSGDFASGRLPSNRISHHGGAEQPRAVVRDRVAKRASVR